MLEIKKDAIPYDFEVKDEMFGKIRILKQ